jgi:hypothetical protein
VGRENGAIILSGQIIAPFSILKMRMFRFLRGYGYFISSRFHREEFQRPVGILESEILFNIIYFNAAIKLDQILESILKHIFMVYAARLHVK